MTSPLRSTAPAAPVHAPRTAPRTAPRPTPVRRTAPGHLRVVEPPVRRGRRVAVGALVVVVVFGALLTAAVLQSVLVTGQDRIDDTNARIELAQRSLQKERARLAAAESPEQLAVAAARIGMVVPTERDWIPSDPSTTGDDGSTDVGDDGGTTSELAAPPGPGTDGTAEAR